MLHVNICVVHAVLSPCQHSSLENSWKTAAVPQYPPFRNARLYLNYRAEMTSSAEQWNAMQNVEVLRARVEVVDTCTCTVHISR